MDYTLISEFVKAQVFGSCFFCFSWCLKSVWIQILRDPFKCEGLGLLLMPCYNIWDLPRSQIMQKTSVKWKDLMEMERVPFVNFARSHPVSQHIMAIWCIWILFLQRVLMCHSNTSNILLSLILPRELNTLLLTHRTNRNQVLVAIFCFVKNSTMWLITVLWQSIYFLSDFFESLQMNAIGVSNRYYSTDL